MTNNDSLSCYGKSFNLSSSLPAGWGTSFSQSSVTLAASSSASVTMTKSIPSNAANGTYSVDATATSATFTGTGLASVTVKPGK